MAKTKAQRAEEWRKENGHTDGLVIFERDSIVGWIRQPVNASSWNPGSIAINNAGVQFKAVGGNPYDGAETWEVLR